MTARKRTKKVHAHLVGIKGVAMAALAVYLSQRGMKITGSDVPEIFPTDTELKNAGIGVMEGFDPAHVSGKNLPDVVYYTGAHGGRDNVEVQAAQAARVPVYPHGQGLGTLISEQRQIVVAGCHGKTTTSAMIAAILLDAGLDPSYAVGCGGITGIGSAGRFGSSDWFVVEGDEYVTDPVHDPTPRFLWLRPEILVITNIDFDHPDVYRNLEDVQAAFRALSGTVLPKGISIINADDQNSALLARAANTVTYGRSPQATYRIGHISQGKERMFFTLSVEGKEIGECVVRVPGIHNVYNATAALIASHEAGISWEAAKKGLATFRGTARRFEQLGAFGGVTFIDDYAHHPTEIGATLKAARGWYPGKKIIAVFQPHTYSRTKSLIGRFAISFKDADTVILTDIYASAREHDTLGIDGRTLVRETMQHHPNVMYGKDAQAVERMLAEQSAPGDVVLFMGAGDIYAWSRDIVNHYGRI